MTNLFIHNDRVRFHIILETNPSSGKLIVKPGITSSDFTLFVIIQTMYKCHHPPYHFPQRCHKIEQSFALSGWRGSIFFSAGPYLRGCRFAKNSFTDDTNEIPDRTPITYINLLKKIVNSTNGLTLMCLVSLVQYRSQIARHIHRSLAVLEKAVCFMSLKIRWKLFTSQPCLFILKPLKEKTR